MTLTIAVNTFEYIRECVNQRIQEFANEPRLYVTAASKEELWDTYLNSFPEEERQSHNCNTCKQFIRRCGSVVRINSDLSLSTVWDTITEGPYAAVGQALRELVLSSRIRDVFVTNERKAGNFHNLALDPAGNTIRWTHFCLELPKRSPHYNQQPETLRNEVRTNVGVLKRGLESLTEESVEAVLDLIAQNSLYRGDTQRQSLETFLKMMREYKSLNLQQQEAFLWKQTVAAPHIARVRNTSIGTLLIDISEGMELDQAVFRYESKMDPVNYRRPRAVYTESSLKKAQQTLEELGLLNSLKRRYATSADLTVNNVLFVDRAQKADDIFTQLADEAPVNPKTFSKVQDITLEKFLAEVLPSSTSLEVFMESRLANNLMSLVCPQDFDAPTFFRWDNGFTWYYNGAVADSIRERVVKAGGSVQGVVRCSLAWKNSDDLDLHLYTPDGHLYYSNRQQAGGKLDVDMNAGRNHNSIDPVENIIFANNIKDGQYKVWVSNFFQRTKDDQGYTVELEYDGALLTFESNINQKADVGTFTVRNEKVTDVEGALKEGNKAVTSKKIWGLSTNCFHKVNNVTLSPNYWDSVSEPTGNKHFFFLLEGVEPEGPARPFLNEYIKEDLLRDHKRVFEVLGSRLPVEGKPELSGLGFSVTTNNHFYCRVKGNFTRVLKVVI